MTRARRVVFASITTLLFLLTLEAILRLAVPEDRLLFMWERADGTLVLEPTGMMQPRPFASVDAKDGPYEWTMRSNGLGLREDEEVAPKKEPGTFRILALGDSYMYGYSVTQGKTLPDQLEQLLPQRLGVQRAEVLNGGIPGGSAFDMLVFWQKMSDRLELDGVLMALPHNDNRQALQKENRKRWYASVVGAPYVNYRTYLMMRRLLAPLLRPRYALTHELPGTESLHDIERLAESALGKGLKVWALEWPGHFDLSMTPDIRPTEEWWKALEAKGVALTAYALSSRACWGFEDLAHPSEAGQRASAEVVANLIATGRTEFKFHHLPRCVDVPGVGPGKEPYSDWEK